VQFKNTRKAFFLNGNALNLQQGDMVAVEATPGHDIGTVSLTGELVLMQLNKHKVSPKAEFKKIYRLAKPADVEKWQEARDMEDQVMYEARKIAASLKLDMKIGDVEFQGDRTKAIFYYIAEERVDFRQLIRVLAERFRVRVEMRQIGARQEAGRIGGIGSCGRELCCSTWLTNFSSVSTGAARKQELALNPQKLAGQCGKLKCCLNFELDSYIDAQKDFPRRGTTLMLEEGKAVHFKTDIFKRVMWFSIQPSKTFSTVAISVDRVKELVEMNKKGEKIQNLVDFKEEVVKPPAEEYVDTVGQDSLTRFDENLRKKKRKKKKPAQPLEKAPAQAAHRTPLPSQKPSPKPEPEAQPAGTLPETPRQANTADQKAQPKRRRPSRRPHKPGEGTPPTPPQNAD